MKLLDIPPTTAPAPVQKPTGDAGRRARRGFGFLLGRVLASQLITLFSGVAIARLLTPADFAAFAVCVYFKDLFSRFCEAGLIGALVQQKEELTERQLRVAFTTQLVILTLIAAVAAAAGPFLLACYPVLDNYRAMYGLLIGAMWVTALRSAPGALLERNMSYGAIGALDLLQTLVNHSLAVALAFAGFGVWSMAVGLLAGSVTGTLGVFFVTGWRPRLAWDVRCAWRLLRFGVPMQANGVVSQLVRGVPAIVIAPAVGATAFGLMVWGITVGNKLQFLIGPLRRVAYPHLCRVHDADAQPLIYGKYLLLAVVGAGAWVSVVFGLGESALLPIYGQKWAGGLQVAFIASVAATVIVIDSFAAVCVNAVGKPAAGLSVALLRAVLSYGVAWALVPPLGVLAGPLSWLLVGIVTSLALARTAGAAFAWETARTLASYLAAVALTVGVQSAVSAAVGSGLGCDILGTLLGLLCFVAAMLLLSRVEHRRWVTAEASRLAAAAVQRLSTSPSGPPRCV